MNKISTFDQRLNEQLKNTNLTQYRLSKMTNIPQTTMSAYMSGRFDPKRENLTAIAKVLKVQEMWLLGYDVPKDIDENFIGNIMSKLSKMNSFQMKKFNEMLDIFISIKQNKDENDKENKAI